MMIRSLVAAFTLSLFFLFVFLFFLLDSAQALIPGARTGTVVKTMNSSGYTYLQLDTDEEKLWVAVPEVKVSQGQKVTFKDGIIMENFHSKTLTKTFESIVFSSGLQGMAEKGGADTEKNGSAGFTTFAEAVKAESGQQAASSMKHGPASGGSKGAVVRYKETLVEKATGENSYTIEEIFSNVKELNGKQVRVRGRVVKFRANIMGKNWIHIQDGSGDPMKSTHDLVVTTDGQAESEETIMITGIVAAGKDFGFGYRYDALIEEAEIIQ